MNPFNLGEFFRFQLQHAGKSLTAGTNKYMPHDGARKTLREQFNKSLSIMSKADRKRNRQKVALASLNEKKLPYHWEWYDTGLDGASVRGKLCCFGQTLHN